MYYYAEINSDYLVINTHALDETSTNANYISITEEQYNDGNLVGQYYNSLLNIFEVIDWINYMGNSNWMTHKDTEMLLSTKTDNMEAEIHLKADINHTHTGYASADDLALLEDVVDTKANADHIHTGYATSDHTHDDYATEVALDTLAETVNEKANANHTHDEYAETTHTHDNYALSTHTHTASEVGASAIGHNHDEDYADINHNHDTVYADIGHDHNTDYATITALNELSTTVSGKASTSHTHNDVYYTETEIDTKLATKSDSSHTHTGMYDINGAAASALTSANAYTDTAISTLSETVDTKVNASALNSHIGDTIVHITSTERTNWNAAKTHADSAHAPTTNATQTSSGLMSADDKAKLDGIANNANNYTLPSAGVSLGGVKTGGDVTIASGVITVNDDSHNHIISNIDGLQSALDSKSASTHNHDTVYDALGSADEALESAKAYTDTVASGKANSSHTHDTLYDAIGAAETALESAKTYTDSVASGKANTSHTHTITDVSGLQTALDGKASSSHGTHVSYSATAPVMDGDASVGTATTVARSDHKHPIDTSRASKTEFDTHDSNTTKHITSTERTNWGTGYTHSQTAHAPSDAEKNQNAFSNVKVGDVTVAADNSTDTLTLIAGTNVTLTPDATGDSVTISSKDTNTTYSAGTGISLSGTTFSNSGVRSIATGGTNGTISVNTNGTSTNVAVKGLGSAAYTASTAYDTAGTAQTKADAALASAKTYADGIKNDLLNGAGTAYDTLKELGDLIDTNVDAIDALETVAASKANTSDLTSHTSNKSNPHSVTLSQLGVTSTAAELNIMDGVTATTTELNYIDGVTSNIQTQLDNLSAEIDGKAASSHNHAATNITSGTLSSDRLPTVPIGKGGTGATTAAAALTNLGITATASELNILDGVTATTTELNYTDGVTSNIQTQLDGKAATSHNHAATNITSGTLSSDRLPTVPISKGGTGATTAASALTNLGITATASELNYVDGVTSNIQTQLNNKAASSHTHSYAGSSSVGGNANAAVKLATARNIGNASFDGTANISAQSICGFATCTGSTSANANKYTKFASVTLEGAYSACVGSFMFAPTEGNSVSGMLNYYLRNGSTVASTSISLHWQHLTNLNYEQSIIAVKISDGVFDLYYKTLNTWDTMKIININCNDPQRITLVSNTGWVDSVTATATSSISSNVSYAKSANTATTATTATKLGTSAGSATQPVYFSDGKPVATTYTLAKSVPSNAVFTDTTYSAATTSAAGLMSASDKSKLDGIATGANAYTLPSAGSSLGGVKSGGDVTISSGTITVNDDSHNHIISNIDGLQDILNNKMPLHATEVTVAGEDLDTYEEAGIYTFAQAYTPTNVPAGTNGWLIVIPWSQGSSTIKQFWLRHGTVDSNDFETYVRTKVGAYDVWGAWSKFYTTSNPPTAAEVGATPAFTNSGGGVEFSYGSGSGKDLLAEIDAMSQGLHTIYSIGGTTNNPKTTESWRLLVHKTSATIGWIVAFGSSGSIYTNYQNAANSFTGWKCVYEATNKMILWSGESYLTSTDGTPQTVTPSKALSQCRTGWLLLWSDYDAGSGSNDIDFCTTYIPKYTPSGGTWGGKAFYCDLPIYVGSDVTDLSTEKRCIKPVYVHDTKLVGSYQNTSGGRNDVVLRAVYEI